MAPLAPAQKSLDLSSLVTTNNLVKNNKELLAKKKKEEQQKLISNKITQGIITGGQISSPAQSLVKSPQELMTPATIYDTRPKIPADQVQLASTTIPKTERKYMTKQELKQKLIDFNVPKDERAQTIDNIYAKGYDIEGYDPMAGNITQAPVPVAPQFPLGQYGPQGQQNDIADKLFGGISNYQKGQAPAVERLIDSVTPLGSIPGALGYTSELGPKVIRTTGRIAQGLAGGLESTIEGAGGILEKGARKLADLAANPFLSKEQQIKANQANDAMTTFKTPLSSDILALGEGVGTLGAYIGAPALTAGFSALPETNITAKLGEKLGQGVDRVGETVSSVPGIKQFRESLPEGDKDRFDQFLGGTIIGLAGGIKGKSNIYKNPKLFIKENINPAQIAKQFQENILNIPGSVTAGAKKIVPGNKTADYLLSSKWKITDKNKRVFEGITGKSPTERALEKGLVGGGLEETADNARNFKYKNMDNKLQAVKSRGQTTTPAPVKVMAKTVADTIKSDILRNTISGVDDVSKLTSEDLQVLPKHLIDLYNGAKAIQNSKSIDFIQAEAIKQAYDHYNPDNLKYGTDGKPVPESGNEIKAHNRSLVQKMLEEEGKKKGIDIKGMNNNIQASTAFVKGADQALNRMENNNPFGLMDSQLAILGGVLMDGGSSSILAPIAGVAFNKAINSEGLRTTLAKKLYNKNATNPSSNPIIDSTNKPMTDRASNYIRGINPKLSTRSIVPKSEGSMIKGPDFIAGPPKKISQIIELGTAKQPSTTKITEGLKKVSENQGAKQVELVGKGLEREKQLKLDKNLEELHFTDKVPNNVKGKGYTTKYGDIEAVGQDRGRTTYQIGGKRYKDNEVDVYRPRQEEVVVKKKYTTDQEIKLDTLKLYKKQGQRRALYLNELLKGKDLESLSADQVDTIFSLMNKRKWDSASLNKIDEINQGETPVSTVGESTETKIEPNNATIQQGIKKIAESKAPLAKKENGSIMDGVKTPISENTKKLVSEYTKTGAGEKVMPISRQKEVSKVLLELPKNKDKVYAGLTLDSDFIYDNLYNGGVFESKRLLSSSTDQSIAGSFADYNPKNLNKVILEIDGGGYDVSELSRYGKSSLQGEKEVLFPIGSKFDVEKIDDGHYKLSQKSENILPKVELSGISDRLYKAQGDRFILNHISTSPIIKKLGDVVGVYTADKLIPGAENTTVVIADLKGKGRAYYNGDHIAIDTKIFNGDKTIRDQVLKHELEHVGQMKRGEISRENPSLKPGEKGYKDQPHEIKAREASGQQLKSDTQIIPKDPLYEEAKKYKSADEFVDNIAKDYHGTDASFEEFNGKLSNKQSNTGVGKGHIFFTDDIEVANSYGKNIKKGLVSIKKPLIVDADNMPWNQIKYKSDYRSRNINDIAIEAQKEGYDGLIVKNVKDTGGKQLKPAGFASSTTTVVFEPSQIKTESQLRKIREEANKGSVLEGVKKLSSK